MYDLNLMIIFAQVVNEQSFSAAARKLGVSRSSVSKAVAKLEHALGASLLNRSTRHLSLTEVGTAFFDYCTRINYEADQAHKMIESLNAQPRGVLKVAASVAFGTLHIAPAVGDFMRRYPELTIDMTITDRVVDLAEEGYDVVICVTRDLPLALVARKLAPIRRKICATPTYFDEFGVPTFPQDLVHHNCLDYIHSGDRGLWRLRGPEGDVSVPVSGRLRINDDEALSQVVLGGFGLALLPTYIIGKDIQAKRLKSVLSEYIPVEQHVYAMYLPKRNLPLKIRVLIDFLIERFGAEPYWDKE
ncbi:transcriptional regulator [Methylophilaceae bacterium 11]|jgi:DNA-binding transcriptional LysR family regulator|uniref:LysR family transcriptional regulator n=1 Tax=Methylotenera sp. N17 TaxID=1502761 RepID=UPI00044CD2CE|nr:LysR family transcriptional regulator [Methylotenera sp. N17]EUJ09375.1 transcriptional regulator [Methylophilaceae bacterium 11]